MTDLATGLYAHGAIMAALLQQQRTGRGSHIDCNLLSSQVSWFPPPANRKQDQSDFLSSLSTLHHQVSCLSHIASNYLNGGQEAQRWGTAHQSIVPYQVTATPEWVSRD